MCYRVLPRVHCAWALFALFSTCVCLTGGAAAFSLFPTLLKGDRIEVYFDNQLSGRRNKRRIDPLDVVPPPNTSFSSGLTTITKMNEQAKDNRVKVAKAP